MDPQYLGGSVRCYRQLLELSQHQLAALAGNAFSQSYVSRLERGLRPSDDQHVDKLAAVLGVSSDDLLRRPRFVRQASRLRPVVLRAVSTLATERK